MVQDWEHSIGIGIETQFGVAAAPSVWLPGESKLSKSPGIRELARPLGEWDETRVTTGPTKVSGSLTLEVSPGRESVIEALLTRRLTGPGAYRTMQSVTVWEVLGPAQTPTDCFCNPGICCNTGTFKCASGEDLTFEAEVMGRERYRATAPAPAFVVGSAWPAAPYVFEELHIGVGGAYEYHMDTTEVKFDHQLREEYGSDATGLVRGLPTNGRKITETLDHVYEHGDLWDNVMARRPVATTLRWVRGSYYFNISLPLCYYNEGDVAGGKQTLELKALKPPGGTSAVIFDYYGRS